MSVRGKKEKDERKKKGHEKGEEKEKEGSVNVGKKKEKEEKRSVNVEGGEEKEIQPKDMDVENQKTAGGQNLGVIEVPTTRRLSSVRIMEKSCITKISARLQ